MPEPAESGEVVVDLIYTLSPNAVNRILAPALMDLSPAEPLSGLLLSVFGICYIIYGEVSMPLPFLPYRCKAIPR